MLIALTALFIALCSLIWNVVSTLRSWQLNKPRIALKITALPGIDGFSSTPSLHVNVMNTSSSTVAITSIFIWAKWKKGGRSGRGIDSVAGDESTTSHISGSPLPFTIPGYHSESWVIDSGWTQLTVLEAYRGQTDVIRISVGMATGKSAEKEIKVDDYFNPNQIKYLTDKMRVEPHQTPILTQTAIPGAANRPSNDRTNSDGRERIEEKGLPKLGPRIGNLSDRQRSWRGRHSRPGTDHQS